MQPFIINAVIVLLALASVASTVYFKFIARKRKNGGCSGACEHCARSCKQTKDN